MATQHDTEIYRRDASSQHTLVSANEREKIIKTYLPRPSKDAQSRPKPIRAFIRNHFHLFVYNAIHTLFSIYIILRQTYHVVLDRILAILYYHHRAPQLIKQDVKNLSRLPQHLSVILESKGHDRGQTSLETLMDEVAEIAAWTACVGIPLLSVYEKTGEIVRIQFLTLGLTARQAYSSTICQVYIVQWQLKCIHTSERKFHPFKSAPQTCPRTLTAVMLNLKRLLDRAVTSLCYSCPLKMVEPRSWTSPKH